MVHGNAAWGEDFADTRRLAARLLFAGQPCADDTHQVEPRQPVIADRFQITLIGVIFLCLGLDQFKDADKHEILFLLAALDDGFARRNQRVAVGSDDVGEHTHALGTETHRIVGLQLQCQQLRPRLQVARFGPLHSGAALVEDGNFDAGGRPLNDRAIGFALALEADLGVANQPGLASDAGSIAQDIDFARLCQQRQIALVGHGLEQHRIVLGGHGKRQPVAGLPIGIGPRQADRRVQSQSRHARCHDRPRRIDLRL